MIRDIQIIIATHKEYQMPSDSMYLPLHVGAEGKSLDFGYTKDNMGDNISNLNPSFCELTGLYWAWKNLSSNYIGLAHYRRHFSMRKKNKNPFDNVLSYEEIKPYLGKIKVFTPNKRKYYIESLYSHYSHSHYSEHLDITRVIIQEKYPEYIDVFDKVMNQTYGYMFNMMIMKKEYFDQYCVWLFDILFELQKRVDMPELSTFQARFYGRVSEIIFNVWLQYQLESGNLHSTEVMEIPCIHMEKINWIKKGGSFLKAKFFGKKFISTWCEPTYQSIWSGPLARYGQETYTYITSNIYNQKGLYWFIRLFSKGVTVTILLFTFLSSLDKRKAFSQYGLLILYLIGGVLFHLMWETKSQYVYGYVFLLIPLGAAGAFETYQKMIKKWGETSWCKKIIRKFHQISCKTFGKVL